MPNSVKPLRGAIRALDQYVEQLSSRPTLRAIRDGLLGVVPCLILSATLLLISVCLQMAGADQSRVAVFSELHSRITVAIPYLVTASIAYMIAIQLHLPRLPVLFLNVAYLICVDQLMEQFNGAARMLFLLSALLIPIWATRGLAILHAQSWCQLTRAEGAGSQVRDTLNFIIPGMLVAAAVILVMLGVILVLPDPKWINYYLFLDAANEPYEVGLTYSILNSLLWFFGVHVYHALLPVLEGLNQALMLNHTTVMAGGSGLEYPMNTSFLGAFVFIGGSGATLSLALALLVTTRVKALRVLALASLPFAFMNVNELLLFGLPIIFNPRLLIPFMLVPAANVLLGLTVIQAGWVQAPFMDVPFNSPIVLNAYLATGGDAGAVLLQFANLAVGMLLYRPFVRGLETRFEEGQGAVMRSIETLFSRRFEEAQYQSQDPVTDGLRERQSKIQLQRDLGELGDYEFLLEYQPQVDPVTGQVTGVEALVRAESSDGRLLSPAQFLPQLERGGVLKTLDLWVAEEACRQADEWADRGYTFPVSINISAEGLSSPEVIDTLTNLLTECHGRVAVEITEDSLSASPETVRHHIERIRELDVQVHIDDFGTGFSALGYLSQYPIDVIKVDRSFVNALETDKGSKVFNGILSFAEALELGVIVEGVETEQQLAYVLNTDRVSVQGWLYSRSLRAEQIPAFVDQHAERALPATASA